MTRTTLPATPGAILGYRRDGRPIRLQAGGDRTATAQPTGTDPAPSSQGSDPAPATARPGLNELERKMREPDTVMQLIKDGKFDEFVKDYADRKTEAYQQEILTQVREETERSMTNWVKENGGQLTKRLNLDPDDEATSLARRKGALYNRRAPGASLDEAEADPPEDLAEFLQSVWHNADKLNNVSELRAKSAKWREIQNTFGSTVPKDGGFLIPEVLRSEILQLALEASVVRGRAQVIPMSSLAVPIPTVDETSRVSSVFGGMVAYWTEEGAAATRSQAKFGRVRLEAKKLTVYCEAPDELIADAPAFGGFLATSMPRATSFYEDVAFLTGSGVGEPLGVLNSSNNGLITTTRQASTGVNFSDVVNVFTRLLPGSYENAVWLVAPDTIPDLLQLVMPTGGTTDFVSPPLWLTGGQAIQSTPMTLLGRPVLISEKVPSNNSRGDLSLVDFSHYLVGDRQMMQASSSADFKFDEDVTAYKIVERVDGRPWVQTPLTPQNNGSTLSPYVTVAA